MIELVKWNEIENQIDIARDEGNLKGLALTHAGLASKEFRKQIDGSIRAINKCEKYKIKIEMAFGDYYMDLEDETINRYSSSSMLTTKKQLAQEEIGKSRETINKYARMANVKKREELLNEYESSCNDRNTEMSSAGFLKFCREEQHKDLPNIELPESKFRIIYADPPWKYGNTMPNYVTDQSDYYPLMTLREICDLPVKNLAEENAVLFLWVTSPILEESFEVVRAWGFKYKSSFIWDKIKHNMGHYNSVRHEILLICTRGSCLPDGKKLYDSVQSVERSERHSEKPVTFRRIIENLYTHGRKIELFAREQHDGWEVYGNDPALQETE